jgi:hypothetical protein
MIRSYRRRALPCCLAALIAGSTLPGAALAGPKTSGGTYDASPLPIPFLDTSRYSAPTMPIPAAPAPRQVSAPLPPAPQPISPAPQAVQLRPPPPVATPAPPPAATNAQAGVVSVTPLNPEYWKGYGRTVVDLATSPFTADRGTLIAAGIVLGGIAGLTHLDDNIKKYTQRHRNKTSDQVADYVRPFGEPILLGGGTLLAFAGGTALGNPKLQETGLLAFESLVIAGSLTEGIKRVAGRQRPNQTDDQFLFDGPGGKGKSFPSGHATHAFSVASVLAEQYDETRYVPALSYTIATLTGLSRINDNKHWASDVAFSAALGYAVGKLVVRNSPFRAGGNAVTVLPYSDGNEIGLNVSARF